MASGLGTALFEPFIFDSPNTSAEITDYTMQAIGDGTGGPGTLILSNFLINSYRGTGMPFSIIHDAAGYFRGELTEGGANSATPASDGIVITYLDNSTGYMSLGPVPIATTAWNTSNAAGCIFEACNGVAVSGALPLIFDNETITYDITANTGGGCRW